MTGVNALCWAIAVLVAVLALCLMISLVGHLVSKRKLDREVKAWDAKSREFRKTIKEGDTALLATSAGPAICTIQQVDRECATPRALVEFSYDARLTTAWAPLASLMALRPQDDPVGANGGDTPEVNIQALSRFSGRSFGPGGLDRDM